MSKNTILTSDAETFGSQRKKTELYIAAVRCSVGIRDNTLSCKKKSNMFPKLNCSSSSKKGFCISKSLLQEVNNFADTVINNDNKTSLPEITAESLIAQTKPLISCMSHVPSRLSDRLSQMLQETLYMTSRTIKSLDRLSQSA